MKTAAGVVAVLAWGSVLAAAWCGYALPVTARPSVGELAALVLVSVLIGSVVPAFLLGLDRQPGAGPGERSAPRPANQWTTHTTRREQPRARRPPGDTGRDE